MDGGDVGGDVTCVVVSLSGNEHDEDDYQKSSSVWAVLTSKAAARLDVLRMGL